MRQELRCGSVDFLCTDEVRAVVPPVLLFLIDTSYYSRYQSGSSESFYQTVLSTIQAQLGNLPIEPEIGFLLFDHQQVTFIRFDGSKYSVIVVPSDDDISFIPDIPSNFFVSPHLLSDQLNELLVLLQARPSIGSSSENPNIHANCWKFALSIAVELVEERIGGSGGSGTICVFQVAGGITAILSPDRTLQPSNHVLPNRVGGDEKNSIIDACIFSDQIVKKCTDSRIIIDAFIDASSTNIPRHDLGDLVMIIGKLGGEVKYSSGSRLVCDMTDWFNGRFMCYDVVLRVRATVGLLIKSVVGNASASTAASALSFPRMTDRSAVIVDFSIGENLEQSVPVFFQFAALYTRTDGTRLIRVHNVMMVPVGHMSQSFKYADADSVVVSLAKRAILNCMRSGKDASLAMTVRESLVAMLFAYRTHCATNSGSGQLVLPDSLKTLPLMILGFLKFVNGDSVSTGSLEYLIRLMDLLGSSVADSVSRFLPRMFCVFPGDPDAQPHLVAATRVKLNPNRIYVFDTADDVVFYIGREVSPGITGELFGSAIAAVGIEPKHSGILSVNLEPPDDSGGNTWIHNTRKLVYSELLSRPGNRQSSWIKSRYIKCIFGGSISGESKVSSRMLIEDRIGNECSYMDWLCVIHKLIQEQVEY